MPNYQNAVPPYYISEGDVVYSFGTFVPANALGAQATYEALPAVAPQAGTQFALPPGRSAIGGAGRDVTWQTKFTGGTPTAINAVLQGAMEDFDGDYTTIDTTTNTTGESRTFANVKAKFLRVKLVSYTHNTETGWIAKILA